MLASDEQAFGRTREVTSESLLNNELMFFKILG